MVFKTPLSGKMLISAILDLARRIWIMPTRWAQMERTFGKQAGLVGTKRLEADLYGAVPRKGKYDGS